MRNRVGGRKVFALTYDMSDINKEIKKFAKNLNKNMREELKTKAPMKAVTKQAENQLKDGFTKSSGRIDEIRKAIGKSRLSPYKTTSAYKGVIKGVKTSGVLMRAGDIKKLDSKTRISALDTKYKQRHNAAFATPEANPYKKIGQPSKNNKRYSLWRIFEYGKRSSYTISSGSPMFYTTANTGFNKWHVSNTVTWESKNTRLSSGLYYMLSINRKIYDSDKLTMYNAVVYGIARILKNKTRFRY